MIVRCFDQTILSYQQPGVLQNRNIRMDTLVIARQRLRQSRYRLGWVSMDMAQKRQALWRKRGNQLILIEESQVRLANLFPRVQACAKCQ